LLGLKTMTAPELLVEIVPDIAPAGREPLAPGGVEFTLIVNSKPVRLTLVPVPVDTMFPRLMILGVTTLLPESEL